MNQIQMRLIISVLQFIVKERYPLSVIGTQYVYYLIL